ncbi:MAG: thioredoxin-dependent thiol peroxidase [Candidatus Aenigmarchaeota archaeon]|nr:thioredoxin-dependent thiol peroxidase [Candidatus Aenigmarchaeota archaeon]
MKLKPGDKAPDFKLPDADGNIVRLSDFRGQFVVLYFYPKDDTPGCTTEACEFQKDERKFQTKGVKIIGISPDPPESHRKFVEKYGLRFTLLSDEGHKVCEKYGVWVEKNMYGRKYMGIARTTFIIGKDGVIKRIHEKVKPEGHSGEVLKGNIASFS